MISVTAQNKANKIGAFIPDKVRPILSFYYRPEARINLAREYPKRRALDVLIVQEQHEEIPVLVQPLNRRVIHAVVNSAANVQSLLFRVLHGKPPVRRGGAFFRRCVVLYIIYRMSKITPSVSDFSLPLHDFCCRIKRYNITKCPKLT